MDHDNCSGEVYGNRAKVSDLLYQRVYGNAEKRKGQLQLHEEWFAEQDQIRDAVSLDDTPFAVVPGGRDDEVVACSIFAEAKPAAHMASAGCAYRYCRRSWRGYVAAALDCGGARGLALRGAPTSTPHSAGWWSGSPRGAGRYAYARALAYVGARRPCAAFGYGCAIKLAPDSAECDPACRCGIAFCWRWPVGCSASARWARDTDWESADWLLLHAKKSLRCRRPIKRASGAAITWSARRVYPRGRPSEAASLSATRGGRRR
ncbi:putative E3 ubiquitin-protein ligase ARI5 [Panicum miliaceum]|uniref:E3 ubiquitin-protein ligase ARI5 n=1 Tax=Panicum miliaceum TaxID=4540 RepID=A0A3L6TLT1_PANMI|nr:putative E3 ubiquitin-protein ligase ARI5 [Panicum miliaceum]